MGSVLVGTSRSRASDPHSARLANDRHAHRSVPVHSGSALCTGRIRRDLGACSQPILQTRQDGAAALVTADQAAGMHRSLSQNPTKTAKSCTSRLSDATLANILAWRRSVSEGIPLNKSRIHQSCDVRRGLGVIPPDSAGSVVASTRVETPSLGRKGTVYVPYSTRGPRMSSSLPVPPSAQSIRHTLPGGCLKTPPSASQLIHTHRGVRVGC